MEAMPGFFIKNFREFLIKCFAEKGFPAGVRNTGIPAAAVDANSIAGIEGRFVFASKRVRFPGFTCFRLQPFNEFPRPRLIRL